MHSSSMHPFVSWLYSLRIIFFEIHLHATFSPMLSSRSFIVLLFVSIFKSMICFELIFVNIVKCVSRLFFFFGWDVWLFQHQRDYLWSIALHLLLCQESVDCIYVGLFLSSLFCSTDLFVLSPVPSCLDYCSLIIFF